MKSVRYILLFESLCQKYNLAAGAVFGKIFNLEIHGKYGRFQGSIDFLAGRLGLSYATVLRAIKLLIRENLIIDITPMSKRNQRMQTRYYKTNQIRLLEISDEMDLITDEGTLIKKLENEIKKKSIQGDTEIKQKLEILGLNNIKEDIEYEDPFEELDNDEEDF